jgi:hypothetical protein
MGNTLNNFRNGFKGVRPNRFLVEAAFPAIINPAPDNSKSWIYVKAADLPGSTIGTIPVAWMGRVVKFSGERMYADWSINCYESNVPADDLRDAFERWIEAMDGRNSHVIEYNLTEDWVVRWSDIIPGDTLSASDGASSQDAAFFNKSVRLKNCFPTDVGSVTLNYDLSDSFSEFTVTMAYDYWEFID